jgi:transposase
MVVTRIAQLEPTRVTVGVDTHRDAHVAVALDQLGRRLGRLEIATTRAGYAQLLAWAESFGEVVVFAVEGCGCYGAGLARHLGAQHVRVVEVMRANRQTRRRKGKSDPTDAEAAGRAVLAGEAAAAPKSGDDVVEMIRVWRVVRVTAMKARTQAINALRSLLVTAPPELRDQLRALSSVKLVRSAARFRLGAQDSPLAASKLALRLLACRYQALDEEIAELDAQLEQLTAQASPHLIESFGVGPEAAAALLIAAGDNPGRLHSEAAFSMLCGSSPVAASSGKTVRYRLNRGGNRQANAALYRIVLVRMRYHQPTKDYVNRRTSEGKSKPEIIRCLKRYVAREVYTALKQTSETNLARTA